LYRGNGGRPVNKNGSKFFGLKPCEIWGQICLVSEWETKTAAKPNQMTQKWQRYVREYGDISLCSKINE